MTLTTYELKLVTTVPTHAVALVISLLVFAIMAGVVVWFTIGQDERPQLNSINGHTVYVFFFILPHGQNFEVFLNRMVVLHSCYRLRARKEVEFSPFQCLTLPSRE